MTNFSYRRRGADGRWAPIVGGIIFFVAIVSASIVFSIYVVKPLAMGPDEMAVDAGPIQPVKTEAPDAGDADRDPNEPPPGWVRIKAGVFTMGSPESEAGRENDEVQHQVTLTRDFLLMESEVAQWQFEEVMGYNPSHFRKCGPDCPVEQVSWHEAAAYCNKLSERDTKVRCYECQGSGRDVTCDASSSYESPYECQGYRLPTEAEWEYAARAADTRATYNGDLDADHLKCTLPNPVIEPVGWFCANSRVEYEGAFNCTQWGGPEKCGPHLTKQLRANPLGLYDMLGNVWEWCHDRHGAYPTLEVVDPTGGSSGADRVLRGGAWGDDAKNLRAALRNWNKATYRSNQHGFRVAISVELTQ